MAEPEFTPQTPKPETATVAATAEAMKWPLSCSVPHWDQFSFTSPINSNPVAPEGVQRILTKP